MTAQAAYDPVATLYDRAFADIRVRALELRWLNAALFGSPARGRASTTRVPARPRVLEIGCGTGALLRSLAPRIAQGMGVDVSPAMLARARLHAEHLPNLHFAQLDSHRLPFPDGAFDVLISFLSFRYLDWEASWPELVRVLAPGGRLLVVDLVREPARPRDLPQLAHATVRHLLTPLHRPHFARDVRALTAHPDWAAMLQRHPMRPLAAYRAFFATRLPGARFESLSVLPSRRVVALDSGPLRP